MGGCGIKAPPVPRDTIVPKRIVNLEAIPREGRLLLMWTVPKENTDKTVLTDLEKFQILRSEGVLVADECRGCGEESKVIYEMKVNPVEEMRGKKLSVLIEDQEPRKVYVYQVVSINRKGLSQRPLQSRHGLLGLSHPLPQAGSRRNGVIKEWTFPGNLWWVLQVTMFTEEERVRRNSLSIL